MSAIDTEQRPQSVYRHRLTVTDYHAMADAGILTEQDRVELIDGELIDMAPIGPQHADLTDYLLRSFARQLPEDKIVRIQNPLQLNRYDEVYPDAAIVHNRRYTDRHPYPEDVDLIVEVADTSLSYDRGTKLPLYSAYRIPEVWIINVQEKCVEIYRIPQPETRRYEFVERFVRGICSPTVISELKLAIDELFPSVSQ